MKLFKQQLKFLYITHQYAIKYKNLSKLACIRQAPSLLTEPGLNSHFIVIRKIKFSYYKKNLDIKMPVIGLEPIS